MGASWLLPTMSLAVEAIQKEARRKHSSFPIKAESGTHTKRPLFLEAHMGASCMLPSVASLMGRNVYFRLLFILVRSVIYPTRGYVGELSVAAYSIAAMNSTS